MNRNSRIDAWVVQQLALDEGMRSADASGRPGASISRLERRQRRHLENIRHAHVAQTPTATASQNRPLHPALVVPVNAESPAGCDDVAQVLPSDLLKLICKVTS